MNPNNNTPWHQRCLMWGQTNLTEIDPGDYNHDWWREHWRRTAVQGLIVNAGGIVAYYPTGFELQYRAKHLGDRDLFGEIAEAAREEGIVVLARMDSNRATEEFYQAHPDWFACDAEGNPCRTGDRIQACVNSPYYKEYLPDVLREIIKRYQPVGFTDNSWGGLGRNYICHCENCKKKFKDQRGMDLPAEKNWDDPAYREWIMWSYACRIENWDLNNETTREAGGEDCLWLGMVNGNPAMTHCSFCDLKAVGERSLIMMCDHQSRDRLNGFEQNGLNGKTLHELMGWDKHIPESMAMYVRGDRAFRRASNPPAESRMWMAEGFAGGISPWWHHVGAHQEDRRQFHTALPMMEWYRKNQEFLINRKPLANVAMVWSQRNVDFYGRDDALERVALPWRGWTAALTRANIPWLPLHLDNLERDMDRFDVIILPEVGAMTDEQAEAIRAFARKGGSIVATGFTGLGDQWGDPRKDGSSLEDVLGIRYTGQSRGVEGTYTSDWEHHRAHNYMRLLPQSGGYNPLEGIERHPVLKGFGETDILPLGGTVQEVEIEEGSQVLATYIPAFPIYPPEFSWMRENSTDVPVITAREKDDGIRVVYFAADVDRCHGRHRLPDHAELLANAVRWAARDSLPLKVHTSGYVDCHLYSQGDRTILHLLNLTGLNQWPGYTEHTIPIGPVEVDVQIPEDIHSATAQCLVSDQTLDTEVEKGRARFVLSQLAAHETIVIQEHKKH
ncbi:MAG: beta-galactosidase [Candidatus Sumerlaeia bacterium]